LRDFNARCDHCGNDYDKSFTGFARPDERTFDSFEAYRVAGARLQSLRLPDLGHGVEVDGAF